MRLLVRACALLFVGDILAADSTNIPAALDAGFQKVTIATNTADPMELAVLPDGRVLFIERSAGRPDMMR